MGMLERVYEKSPIFFQNIMVSVKGYRNNSTRYGKTYWEHRSFLEDFDTWDIDEKHKYQLNELYRFLQYAATKSPYYKKLYEGIDINSLKSFGDLKKLPVLDKEMIRTNIDDMITISKDAAIVSKTGGTTGTSLTVFGSNSDMMKRMAMLDHFKARVGFEHRKMRRATFNSNYIVPPKQKAKVFWRYNRACKQMIYSAYHLSEENLRHYVDSLNKFKPHAIDGFLMPMVDIAKYIKRHSLRVDFVPVAIFPTSETLTQANRELLQEVFNCKVYDQYASAEGAPFVVECEHQKLHIEMASGVFEHFGDVDEEILVTSFTTHGTPLIRYRIGDAMKFSDETSCACGMQSLMVKEIYGRKDDFLYTADGAKIRSVSIANLIKNVPNAIIRIQMQQDKLGEILILMEIDKEKYKPEYDEIVKRDFLHRFGEGTVVDIKHVDEIPREKSGKFRLIKNNVG